MRHVSIGKRVGIVALVVSTLGVGITVYFDRTSDESLRFAQSAESIAFPLQEPLPRLTPAAPAPASTGSVIQAPPIDTLIGGLEARLAAEPNDASGWTLLAQSYAFVANTAEAENAVRRAVALGVDEQTLRDQVRRAERSAPPKDWVQEMIRPKSRE
jgi:hypothetical protein